MTNPAQAESYIRFQLHQLSSTNSHHEFETICFRVASARVSSNLLPATGPVSSGGDQGRDGESFSTDLPAQVPGAGGFINAASTRPTVLACTIQQTGLRAKVKADLTKICGSGEPVSHVAYFSVAAVPVALRHELQRIARTEHSVTLDIFDGEALSVLLAQPDLVWVAEHYLQLPANLVPTTGSKGTPEWYERSLGVLRKAQHLQRTLGNLSAIRDGLRHSTFDKEARPDLAEWLRFMREMVGDEEEAPSRLTDEVSMRARYEIAVASIRGLKSLDGVPDYVKDFVEYALSRDEPSFIEDASVLVMYCGGAWAHHLGELSTDEIAQHVDKLTAHVDQLLIGVDAATYPNRAAHLLYVAAHLQLHPRWSAIERRPLDTVQAFDESLREFTEGNLEGWGDIDPEDQTMIDVAAAMARLEELVDILPRARTFPVESLCDIFEMLSPLLIADSRYNQVRNALDGAIAEVEGDNAVADRCRNRAFALWRAGRPLDALHEFHQSKVSWWHGDTIRGAVLAMRLIGVLYRELRLPHAAKQYALSAAAVAAATTC